MTAKDVLCHSSQISEALVQGGQIAKQFEEEVEEVEHDPDEDTEEEFMEPASNQTMQDQQTVSRNGDTQSKMFTAVGLKNKIQMKKPELSISLGDGEEKEEANGAKEAI